MMKQHGNKLMQKWKNKAGVRLSALDKKKLVLTNLPYVLTAFYADRASCLYRRSPGEDIGNKLLYAMEHADRIFTGILLSFDLRDLLVGVTVAVILKLLVWQKQSDAKKLRKGIEYGSARWGTAEDIKPYMSDDPWMNIPLTATEALTMESRPKQPKYARNKNIVVIGGSGSGKTRFFVKPSVMQMNCSMVITDPKGTLIEECGKMLAKGPPKRDKDGNVIKDKSGKVVYEPYVIKVLNTINFSKSLHYNPFAYIRSEKDILKLVTTIIANTKGEGEKSSEDFWVKAEKLLYTALIAFIWYEGDEEEKNLNTLLDLLNESETREEDETYQNPVDMMFQELEERDPQHFAVRQYKKYKMASAPAVIWQMRIIWFVAVGVIFIMAPVDASSKKLDAKEKKVYGMRARVILVIECAIAGVFSVIGYSLIVNGIMVAHIVLASGLILGWIKNFFDKELDITNYR